MHFISLTALLTLFIHPNYSLLGVVYIGMISQKYSSNIPKPTVAKISALLPPVAWQLYL